MRRRHSLNLIGVDFGLVKKARIKANKFSIKIKGKLISRPFHYEKFVVIPLKVAIVIREV